MDSRGHIGEFTDEEVAAMNAVDRSKLVELTALQAEILSKLPQEDRAELYPAMKTLGFKLKPGEIPIG